MGLKAQIPNVLSISRILVGPCMLLCPEMWRLPLLLYVVFTDVFDGYLARRWNVTSHFGTIVDPIGDKGIAIVLGYLFWSEGALTVPQLMILFSREWALLLFTGYAVFTGRWREWKIQSFWCGKAATILQAIIAWFLCLGLPVPIFFFCLMALSGLFALPELIMRMNRRMAPNLR